MATYLELEDLFQDPTIKTKVRVAVIVAAEAINTEAPTTPNHVNRLLWAKRAFGAPDAVANEVRMAVLAANKGATVAQITGASDAAVQANVDAVVDLFADGV